MRQVAHLTARVLFHVRQAGKIWGENKSLSAVPAFWRGARGKPCRQRARRVDEAIAFAFQPIRTQSSTSELTKCQAQGGKASDQGCPLIMGSGRLPGRAGERRKRADGNVGTTAQRA